MNKKQEKMVSDYIENNQNFIQRIQKEIGRYENTDVNPFYERMKNQEEKADRIESNIRKEWIDFRKNNRDLPFKILAKRKEEFNQKNVDNFNTIEEERKILNSYRIAYDGMTGIKITLLCNVENLIQDYLFEFLKENKSYFKYSLASESYKNVFLKLVSPIKMYGKPIELKISHYQFSNKNVYKYYLYARRNDVSFDITKHTGHLDMDNLEIKSVTVIPYEMIIKRAIELQDDEKRIQEAKSAFEKMTSEIEMKYKAFEFHPNYYNIEGKNF